MPGGAVQRTANDGLSDLAGPAHVARAAHGGVLEREAPMPGGVKRGERGIKAALLVKARGTTVLGEVKAVGANRVGGE